MQTKLHQLKNGTWIDYESIDAVHAGDLPSGSNTPSVIVSMRNGSGTTIRFGSLTEAQKYRDELARAVNESATRKVREAEPSKTSGD